MSTSVLQKQFIHANALGQPTAEGLSFKLLRRRNSSPSPLGAIGETKWLVSRWFDLFFVCGLAPWIFGALFFLSNGANGAFKSGLLLQQPMTILFIGSSLLIGESHQFTSIIRYYTSFRKREKKYRLQRVPFWIIYSIFGVTILMTMGGFGVRTEFFGLGWTFQLLQFFALMAVFAFPAVLLQHVCAQAIAIVQVYCRNSGYSVSDNERGTLNATSWLLTCVGMFSIAMPFGMNRSGFFGIEPEQLPTYATAFAVVAVAAGVNVGNLAIRRGLQTGEWPPIAAVILFANLTLFTLLPMVLPAMTYVFLFVPLLFHATQHWGLAWHVKAINSKPEPNAFISQKSALFLELVVPVIAVTLCVLFSPLISQHLRLPVDAGFFGIFSSDQTLNVFLSMAVFYLHYFADRIVWRTKS